MSREVLETYYEKEDSGKVVFEERKDAAEDIQKYIELIEELKKSPEMDEVMKRGLEEIAFKFNSLKYSEIPLPELKQKIKAYSSVPLGNGKFLHLSSYLSSTGSPKVVKDEQEYLDQVQKMVKNTMANLTNLMIFRENDEHLAAFFDELKALDGNTNYSEVKSKMDHLTMSGIIKHYNQIKLDFLKSWLAPFEAQLGQAAEKMTPKEIQASLAKVESLKKKKLEQIGMRLNPEMVDPFRPYNRTMHEIINGKSTDFWGYAEYRDEFVELIKKIINRFSFKLENHYLVFESSDKTMAYLVGFPDDTFLTAKKLKDGRTGLTPHMKIFFQTEGNKYKELIKEDMEKSSDYYRALKTAAVPFLSSMSMIVESPLSQGLQDAFEMWI